MRFQFLLIASLAASAVAGDEAAVTDPAKADADFFVQGEYLGERTPDGGQPEAAGLQVVAMGDGQFEGMAYRGGLPGWGWDEKTRWKVVGSRSEGTVVLSGEPGTVRLLAEKPQAAEFVTFEGHSRGALKRVVRQSRTMGLRPPSYATVLFDGNSAGAWKDGRVSPEGLLLMGTSTRRPVKDFALHLEFRAPYVAKARGQGRGNSGVYIQERYEVQILDSFGLEGRDNECGGLYKPRRPDLNMCLPPLAWQTYDIDFRSPRFASGTKVAEAKITVKHNGVLIHRDVAIPNKTGGGALEGPERRPIKLQDHGNPLVFRNIWIVEYCDAPTQGEMEWVTQSTARDTIVPVSVDWPYDPCCVWPVLE